MFTSDQSVPALSKELGSWPAGDWPHPVPVTGLWLILLSLCRDKLPRTPVLSGEFPVRSFFSVRD